MTNKQINLIKETIAEFVMSDDRKRYGTLFKKGDYIYLYNAMGSFMIKFKDSEDIKYLTDNFEIKTEKDVPKTVTDDTWFLGYNCYTNKPYTFSYFKEFVRDIKDLGGKCVDFLDTEINYNIIVNYDLLTKLYDLTRGKFTIGYLDCNAPLHFENNKYEAILMPVYVGWVSNEDEKSQQDEIPNSTETKEFNGKKTFHLPRGEWQNKFCEFLENNNFGMYGYPQEDSHKDYIKDIGNFARFENDTFILMPYYWGDDDAVISLPNFIYKPENITISWYKYPLRGATCSQELTYDKFLEIIKKCDESLK